MLKEIKLNLSWGQRAFAVDTYAKDSELPQLQSMLQDLVTKKGVYVCLPDKRNQHHFAIKIGDQIWITPNSPGVEAYQANPVTGPNLDIFTRAGFASHGGPNGRVKNVASFENVDAMLLAIAKAQNLAPPKFIIPAAELPSRIFEPNFKGSSAVKRVAKTGADTNEPTDYSELGRTHRSISVTKPITDDSQTLRFTRDKEPHQTWFEKAVSHEQTLNDKAETDIKNPLQRTNRVRNVLDPKSSSRKKPRGPTRS